MKPVVLVVTRSVREAKDFRKILSADSIMSVSSIVNISLRITGFSDFVHRLIF
jgi:hypothetical protein